jgi:antitoxin FitA
MAQFTVRNLEDDIYQKLRKMADTQGQSLEECVRQILRRAALEHRSPPSKLGTKIAKRFKKTGLQQPIAELRGHPVVPPSFE